MHGAVSEPVAVALADGIRTRTGADVTVGITGIAGPDGGTPAKPVGTVSIAAIVPDAPARVRTFLPRRRQQIKFFATQGALDMVRRRSADRSAGFWTTDVGVHRRRARRSRSRRRPRMLPSACASAEPERARLSRALDRTRESSRHAVVHRRSAGGITRSNHRGAAEPCVPQSAFPLSLAGCGAFPPSGQPRVLWIGVHQGLQEMRSLHREIGERLEPPRYLPERREYAAHLTIARVKDSGRGAAREMRSISTSCRPDCGVSQSRQSP